MQAHLSRQHGFTLIEIMIVIAIIALLASVAYPAYQKQMLQTRRSAAQACLMELGQAMERYYSSHTLSYGGAKLPALSCVSDLSRFYDFSLSNVSPNTFTVTAKAKGIQLKDTSCTSLALDQGGARNPASCWQK